MRHHRRAENAEAEIEHVGVGDEAPRRREAARDLGEIGTGQSELRCEAKADQAQHPDDEKLDLSEAQPLHGENEKRVQRRGDDAERERQAEEQLQPDRRADDLGEVRRENPRLGEEPKSNGDRVGRMGPASLGEVESGADAEPRGKRLQHNGHQARQHGDKEQRRPELRAAGQRRGPIAGVHIAGGDEIAGA